MSFSRLRLRLGLGFSLAFAFGLAVLAAVSLGYLWRESHRRLDERLDALVNDVSTNLALEWKAVAEPVAAEVASEVVGEWPRNGGSFVIRDDSLNILAHNDSTPRVLALLRRWTPGTHMRFDTKLPGGEAYRLSGRRFQVPPSKISTH